MRWAVFALLVLGVGCRGSLPEQDQINARVRGLLTVETGEREADWAHDLEVWLPRATFAELGTDVSEAGGLIHAALAPEPGAGDTFNKVVERVTAAGCGLSLSVEGKPSVEMSFGVLATYRMFEDWRSPPGWNGGAAAEGTEIIRREEIIRTGAPNEEYLPQFVRTALRRHLESAGIKQPRVLLVLWPDRANHRDLAFNIRRAGLAPEDYDSLMRSLSWYLPQGYQCISWDSVAGSEASAQAL